MDVSSHNFCQPRKVQWMVLKVIVGGVDNRVSCSVINLGASPRRKAWEQISRSSFNLKVFMLWAMANYYKFWFTSWVKFTWAMETSDFGHLSDMTQIGRCSSLWLERASTPISPEFSKGVTFFPRLPLPHISHFPRRRNNFFLLPDITHAPLTFGAIHIWRPQNFWILDPSPSCPCHDHVTYQY